MEMLLKHARAKNFLAILKERRKSIKALFKQLNRESRRYMIKFAINETQDESKLEAVNELVQILITDLPKDKDNIMTFAEQLKLQGLQQGQHKEDLIIAKRMLARGYDYEEIKEITQLSDQDLLDIES